jgi:hypothetical protein
VNKHYHQGLHRLTAKLLAGRGRYVGPSASIEIGISTVGVVARPHLTVGNKHKAICNLTRQLLNDTNIADRRVRYKVKCFDTQKDNQETDSNRHHSVQASHVL